LALYFRCFDAYPIVVAANRDEHYDRPSAAPSLLDGQAKMIAGRDLRVGGTWLGFNEFGLMAAILNRRVNGTALPPSVARSRGLLCMQILQAKTLADAVSVIEQDTARYNPFTVVFADRDHAYVAYNDETKINLARLSPGLHVFSSAAEFELHSAKAERAYTRFAGLLDPPKLQFAPPAQWLAPLQNILSDHSYGDGSDNPGDAICVHRDASGTVSSSVIFFNQSERQFTSFHCAGAPCQNAFGEALKLAVR
jgi:uncharacterized protein with NRDE domain